MSEIRNQPSANRIVAENLGVAALIYLLALAENVAEYEQMG
jgi:hypothetical protein